MTGVESSRPEDSHSKRNRIRGSRQEHYHFPWQLEQAIRDFVAYYNHERYHESLENVTPADVYHGRHREVLSERKRIKQLTMKRRKREYRAAKAA